MIVLITGAAGFIGSHVSEYYLEKGYQVIGIDNFDDFYPEKYKKLNLAKAFKHSNFQFFQADIRDREKLDSIFAKGNIDFVIHLAAKAGVRPSIESVFEYYDVNINGTLILLETMKAYNVTKMLFASSSSVYGNNSKVPFSETDNVDSPISPYASTKKSGELLCHVYCHLHGFDITCLRFFTVFGPRQRPDLAIHKFTQLIDSGKPIPIFGDGSTARDYTYIADIVEGINKASLYLNGFRIFNLGESRIITLNQMVSAIEKAIGKKALLKRMDLQQGDVLITYADISKAKTEIGYDPKYTFDEGIAKFVAWYQEYKHLLY